MSWETFDDTCDGCKPAILNIQTGRTEPDDSPIMQAVLRAWDQTTLEERQAYHRVCCQRSTDEPDLKIMNRIGERMKEEMQKTLDVSKN